MGSRATQFRRGFTLIEILLVIALIGLLSGLMLTDWGNVADSFGRRSWRQSIEETFRRAHYLAETGDQAIRLRFDPEERTLHLEEAESGELLESTDLSTVESIRRVTAPGLGSSLGNLRSDDYFTLRFGRDGSAEPIFFEVTRESSRTTLHNHPFSGRILDEDDGNTSFFR
ncbi:MAG: type II secretion system protein [Puniceicoccales bacterium]